MSKAAGKGRSIFSSLAVPYTFGPDLGVRAALVAVTACLVRIFGACVMFAVWGGLSAYFWSVIGSPFWRVAAMAPMVMLFVGALAGFMLGVSKVARMGVRKRD